MALFRYDGKVSAISNVCRHQNGPLGEGKIVDGCVVCPWHGYQYRPHDGTSPPPFTEKVPTFRVKVAAGRVLVDPRPLPPGTPVEAVLQQMSAYDLVVFRWGFRASDPSLVTLFTGMFLHAGFMHLAGNMLYLWIFADNVEDSMGRGRFLVFYLLCGIAAALAQALPDPSSQVPMIGASGAVSGVIAAYLGTETADA